MIITPETNKSVEMSQDSLDKLEKSIFQSINSLKDEIINLKDTVVKNFQDENTRLKVKCENLENRVAILESNYNDLAQHGSRKNVVFSGIPKNVRENILESTVISVLSDIDVQSSQGILRHVIELAKHLPKHRGQL